MPFAIRNKKTKKLLLDTEGEPLLWDAPPPCMGHPMATYDLGFIAHERGVMPEELEVFKFVKKAE